MVVENGHTKGLDDDGTEVAFKNGNYGATNGKDAANGTIKGEEK